MSDVGVLLGGNVAVATTSHRGFTPEEIAERALDKILFVGAQSHPVIREQAEAFREQIRHVLVHYMREAVLSERTTLANRFRSAGRPELIDLLKQE